MVDNPRTAFQTSTDTKTNLLFLKNKKPENKISNHKIKMANALNVVMINE